MESKQLIAKLDALGIDRNEYSLFKEEKGKYCLRKHKYIGAHYYTYTFYYVEESGYRSLTKYFSEDEYPNPKKAAYEFFYEFFANNKYRDEDWVYHEPIGIAIRFEVEDGINIWDYKWHHTGKLVNVKDCKYEQQYLEEIKEIRLEDKKYEFLAFEVSANSWVFYLKKEHSERLKVFYRSKGFWWRFKERRMVR